jgi:chaperonin GroES
MATSFARKFVPMMDRVLVQKVKPELKSAGGVLLPETATTSVSNQFAKVLSVGTGRYLKDGTKVPCSVRLGDTVIVPEFGGMKLRFEDEECHVYRDEDIVGIVKDDA